jgi:hypothetical protein
MSGGIPLKEPGSDSKTGSNVNLQPQFLELIRIMRTLQSNLNSSILNS